MPAFLQTAASFAAICVLCAFLARHTKLPAAMTPLPVVCFVMVFTVCMGYLGLLVPSVIFIFALAIAALFYMLFTAKKAGFKQLLTPGFVLFCAAGLVFIAYFAIRQPIAQEWDEFSLWATAAKLTKGSNTLYHEANIGWFWAPGSQKAGLPTLAYFFNFLGEYAAWRMYAAYAVLYAAVWSAAMGVLKRKNWQIAVPAAVMMFLLPYFTVYMRDIYCNFIYLNAYGDYPMGVLMAGALAWYYNAKKAKIDGEKAPLGYICLFIAAITLCKDTGLPLAMITAAIITFDMLFSGFGEKLADVKNILKKLGFFVLMATSSGGVFVASSKYLASLGSAQGSVGGSSDMGYATMLIEGTKALLGLSPSAEGAPFAEKFAVIKTEMLRLFFAPDVRVTMAGSGFMAFLLIMLILAVGAVLTNDKKLRRASWLYAIASTLGFALYYTFIGFTYVYVFKDEGTALIHDYNRYMNTYYLAWLGGVIAIFVLCAYAGSRFKSLLTLGTAVLACGMLLRFNHLMLPQLCVIDYPDVVYNDVKTHAAAVSKYSGLLTENDRVYYVNTFDNGLGWFETSYDMLPAILTYSHGGGEFADGKLLGTTPRMSLSADEWAAELFNEKCTYVYIDKAGGDFFASYGTLFSDEGINYNAGETRLYKVNIKAGCKAVPLTADDVLTADELDKDDKVADFADRTVRMKIENSADWVTLTPVTETEAAQ